MIIGKELNELDTPALWVDLDIMERNIYIMSDFMKKAGVNWRPHTKGIKVPEIAHMLIESGAMGVTCAKQSEAEVLASAGIKDILIANQVVGRIKVVRLVNLQKHADVMVAVDSLSNATELSDAAKEKGVQIRVLIEVNIGMNRCGLDPGPKVLDLARHVSELPGIRFMVLMGYEGHLMGIQDPVEKKQLCTEAIEVLVKSANMIRQTGMEVDIVSCSGSGDYYITAYIPGITEIQAGGAVFSDVTYKKWGADTVPSIFVLATIISRTSPKRAVVDAGRKAMNGEVSLPCVQGIKGAELVALHAEHGLLDLESSDVSISVGDKVNFIVGYGDNTVYLHDYLYGVRDEKVEIVWKIQGRGKLT